MTDLAELVQQIKAGDVTPAQLLDLFEQPVTVAGVEVSRSSHWPKVRAAHLVEHPACEVCLGTDFLQVHHIMPFHLHPELELDVTNLITLCEKPSRNCHFTWGHFYNWSTYNPNIWKAVVWWRKMVEAKVAGVAEMPEPPILSGGV